MLELIQTYLLYFLVGLYPNGPLGGLALTLILAVMGLWALVGVACLCAGMVLADVPERVSTRLNRGDREGV